MSLNRPAPNPPYPYYPSGIVREVGKTKTMKRRRGKRRGVKGMFSRERQAEQIFKFGQIRSGLEGLATFRGRRPQRVPREQVVSDFFRVHQQALRNRARDEAETQRRLLIKDDERKTSAERRAVVQLQLQNQAQQDNIRLQRATLENQARTQQSLMDLADRFIRSQDERERRQGEFQERLLGLQKVGGQSDNREILEGLRSINQTLQQGFDPQRQQRELDKIYENLVRATLGQKPPPPPQQEILGGSPRFEEITTPVVESPPPPLSVERQNPLNQTLEPTSTIPYHRAPEPEGAKPQNRVMRNAPTPPPAIRTREQLAQTTPSVPFVGRADAPKQSMADYVAQQMAREHDGGLQQSVNESVEIQKARTQTAPQSADNQPSGIIPLTPQELAEIKALTQPTERPSPVPEGAKPTTPPPTPQVLEESVEVVRPTTPPRTTEGKLGRIVEEEQVEEEPIAEPELQPQLSQTEVRRLQEQYAKEVENNKRVQEQFVKATEQFKAGKMTQETYDAIGRAHKLQAKEVSKLHEKLEFQKYVISPFYQPSREEQDAGFVAGGGTPVTKVRVGGDGQKPLPPITVQEKKEGAPPTPPPTPPQEFDVSVEATGRGVVEKARIDEAQRRADKEKQERHEYEQRTQARLQYLQQLKSSAKGNRKKQILKDAQTFPALEILEAFPDTSWINPRRKGSRFKNAPTQKGIYRFKNLGSGDATGNTRKFNLYRDNSGKPKGQKGTQEEWQLDLHEHPDYFDQLIRQGKIRFKDVDIGE
jgi:hypothetical protein